MVRFVDAVLSVLLSEVLSVVFGGEMGLNVCSFTDRAPVKVGDSWINEKGCGCVCTNVSNSVFSVCDQCSRIKNAHIPKKSNTCLYNGNQYNLNEKWPSSEKMCAICQCLQSNTVSCTSEIHCINTCQEGQIPQYGSCCEVTNCNGNASIVQGNVDCLVEGKILHHGKSMVRKFHCKDKFCTCNNGQLLCFDYCEPSQNSSHYYWDRLCCPRKIGNEKCKTNSGSVVNAGETLVLDHRTSCRCLDGEIYCTKENSTSQRSRQSPSKTEIKESFTDSSSTDFSSTELYSFSTSKSPQKLTDHTLKELFVILCLFVTVILVLVGIVFIFRMRYNRQLKDYQTKNGALLQHEDSKEFDTVSSMRLLNYL